MILYIGNILSSKGYNPPPIEYLKPKIKKILKIRFEVVSDKKNKFYRFFHMNYIFWKNINNISLIFIDVYSTQAFYFAFYFSILARLFSIPYIPVIHGGQISKRIKKRQKLSDLIFNRSKINIAPSNYIYNIFIQNGYNIKLIPNGIDLSFYTLKKRKIIEPNLLWVRSFHKIYNPEMAIYVLNKLLVTYPEAKLTMVGPDKDGSQALCKNLARTLNISKKVNFTGYLPKKDWIKLSINQDLFINTTNIDNMPVSIIEVMALGIPIISTNVGGLPFLLKHEKNALLVDSNDILAMTKNIDELITNPTLAFKISMEAYNNVQLFSIDMIYEDWVKLILDSLKK